MRARAMLGAVIVRCYQPEDRAALIELWRRVFDYREPRNQPERVLEHKLTLGDELLFVAVRDAKLVGALMAGYDGHRGWFYRAAVEPGARRSGVGRALVRAAEAALRERGCAKINLQTAEGNADAVAFWERLGYRVESHVSMARPLDAEPDGGC